MNERVHIATGTAPAEAVPDERTFIACFGFDAVSRNLADFIALKQGADLTDREIRWLKLTGCLSFSGVGATLVVPWWMAVVGWVFIVSLSALMLSILLLAPISGIRMATVLQVMGVYAVLAVFRSVSPPRPSAQRCRPLGERSDL